MIDSHIRKLTQQQIIGLALVSLVSWTRNRQIQLVQLQRVGELMCGRVCRTCGTLVVS